MLHQRRPLRSRSSFFASFFFSQTFLIAGAYLFLGSIWLREMFNQLPRMVHEEVPIDRKETNAPPSEGL